MKRNKLVSLITLSLVSIIALTGLLVACGTTTSTVTVTQTGTATTATTTATATATATTTATATATATATVKPITLIFSTHDPITGSWSEFYPPLWNRVEQRTGGLLRIEEHYGGELAGLFEQFGAVVDGTVDIGHIYPTTQPNTFPMEQISLLHSFNIETLADSQMYTELMSDFPEMQQAYTDAGLKLLFKIASFPSYFATTPGKEIRSFDDLNGKKWLSTGPWDSANWEAMGMTPVQIMPQETYTSVQTGLLDGICTTLDFLYDFGVQDLVTKVTNVHIRPASWSCAMNLDVWNKLPKEFQDAIMAEAAEAPMIRDQMELRIDVELRAKLAAEEGTEFIDMPQADQDEMQAVTEGVRQSFVDLMNDMGLPGQELLDKALELEKKYAGQEYALKE